MRLIPRKNLSAPEEKLAAKLINGRCADVNEEVSIAAILAQKNYQFPPEVIPRLSRRGRHWGLKLAFILAYKGYVFTVDQLEIIGDSADGYFGRTVSLEMASHGHQFPFEEVVRLKNPRDHFDATLAHWLAAYGKIFSVDEILTLGNPVIRYYEDDIYDCDVTRAMSWCISEISQAKEYESRRNLLHNGATIAHIMAREGHRFTDLDIIHLGNPKDKAGLTIKDWMDKQVEIK
jgi:hypothetical protein